MTVGSLSRVFLFCINYLHYISTLVYSSMQYKPHSTMNESESYLQPQLPRQAPCCPCCRCSPRPPGARAPPPRPGVLSCPRDPADRPDLAGLEANSSGGIFLCINTVLAVVTRHFLNSLFRLRFLIGCSDKLVDVDIRFRVIWAI